ncbi:MAG: glycoside hydrolase family 57 protein [Bacteroidales bacterium]|nr:glycoside hydrolase family 57 protein [Bacteroidales bacterium]
MKNICLHFSVHQPFRLRSYRFFDIGQDHYYYDDFSNKSNALTIAKRCYVPMNNLLLSLINANKNAFKVSFSITGSALEQFEMYTPEVIEGFKKLAKTGCVEFVAEPDAHSLASVANEEEFALQVKENVEKISSLFGQKPKVLKNTGLIYSDSLGEQIYKMGFQAVLAEGSDQILGWKSPNYVYCCDRNPRLKVLLRNYKLSDDISLRFSNQGWSEWPLTSDKFANWVTASLEKEDVVNLFVNYKTFGEYNRAESGIFDFFSAFVALIVSNKNVSFATPSEVIEKTQPISVLSVPQCVSNADEERDLSAWLGNNLQKQAFDTINSLQRLVRVLDNPAMTSDWNRLQASENILFMSTKFFNHDAGSTPYQTPYEAFINFMNVVSDFAERLNKVPMSTKFSALSQEEIDAEIAKQTEILKELESAKKKQQVAKPAKKVASKKSTVKAETKKADAKTEAKAVKKTTVKKTTKK